MEELDRQILRICKKLRWFVCLHFDLIFFFTYLIQKLVWGKY
ncbi:unnamed protein product [Haemonchus placei]|uniref:Uncharacterized protein n=1 Tax=Haemonchus placei TaxID=6290 RepID=A0A0N4X7E3_HAEPC|nr:unnamed protein product [Haemonchus placei]